MIANNFNYSFIKIQIIMNAKLKSGKIAIGKILIGMMMAVCLLVVSAFGQVEPAKSKSNQDKAEQIKDKVYEQVEQMPEFSGGQSELVNFLMKSIQYPDESKKKGTQGKVFVSFVVDKDGSIKNAKILRAVDPLLDAEALRVVKSMPKWTPGKEKGKAVAVQFTLPIKFALK